MKLFNEIRKNSRMPPGEHVFSKKVDGVDVMIHKQGSKFVAFIDGDKLDSYPTQAQAEKMAMQFVKQYKETK
jgi:hypothetical protein